MKHLFAHEFNGKVEQLVDDVRIDVVMGKIALEIEAGTNKGLQVQKKIEVLEKNFKEWYIICPEKIKRKYTELAPKDRILTMNDAYKHLKKARGSNKA